MPYAKTLGLQGGGGKAQAEAVQASSSPLGLVLQSRYVGKPALVVVVAVYPSYAELLSVALALFLPHLVFLSRIDVGIIIEYCGTDTVCQHPFHYCRRTGGAAGVQQHLTAVVRQLYRLLPLFLLFTSRVHHLNDFSCKSNIIIWKIAFFVVLLHKKQQE